MIMMMMMMVLVLVLVLVDDGMTFSLCEYIVPRGCEHTDTDETIMSLHYRRPQLPPFHK